MEYSNSNEDYVKQFLILLGYVMIFCFIYLIKYILVDVPNELKKWSPSRNLDKIINKLENLNFSKKKDKILKELGIILNDIENIKTNRYIENQTKLRLLEIIEDYIHKLNNDRDNNQKKIEYNKEITNNLRSLKVVIEKFRIRNHPLNY